MEYENNGTTENTMPADPVSPKGRNRIGLVLIAIACTCIFFYGVSAPASFFKGESVFTVVPGQSLKSVGTELKSKHYIQSRFLFATLVAIYGSEKTIPSGDYFFDTPVTVFSVARRIAFGMHNINQIKVTIPEGDTAMDIGRILAQKISGFDAKTFDEYARPHEGYLFPETYFLYRKTDPKVIADEMLAMFDSQTAELFGKNPLPHSGEDIVTMASIIEREAHGSDDRAVISGILWNRISRGMRLQVDATVAYAVGKSDTTLLKSDFSVDSPYNTYLHKGLPPGPISNPGLQALKAALLPSQTAYLYYLHDSHGTIHYAKTYAEHLANIKKYLK